MSDIKRFFKHSSIYAVGNIINRIGAFVLLPVYTNYLSVTEYGVLEIFYIISSIISGVLAIGLAHATLRFYFEYDDQRDRNQVVSTNFIGSLLISIIGVSVVALIAPTISEELINNPEYVKGIYLVLGILVFELSSQICLAYVRAIEYSMFFVFISIAKLIIQVALNSYLVIVVEAGVIGILVGNLVTVIVGWLVLSIFTLRKCGFGFKWKKFQPVITYSFPFLLSTIVGLVSTNVDKFILNYMVSLEALGLYALALKFSMIIEQLVGEPFSRSYGAFRYTIMKDQDVGAMQASIVKYLLIITSIVSLGIAFFVKELLIIMSEPGFWKAADIVPVVLIASIFKIMTYPAQSGILFAKKTGYLFYFTFLAACVSAASNYIFISLYGLIGAAISLVITEGCVLFVTNKISQKYLKVNYEYGKMFVIIFIAAALYLVSFEVSDSGMLISLTAKSALMLMYIAFLYYSPVLNEIEKQKMMEFIRLKLKRKKPI